ncbi:methionine aminopeptidase [Plesiocystis pacifica SIR-1]|uniref:Methionine aminopeptidase n=1 Tax=Plesiocystis pacifica SIR-1 TaxID=391625 RepID=A6GK14_9BACT|nr:type I methionyl aminopeptidase [Plesiocystis pacifica]EDM73796.1 methionine aminopeptidase [Plesiocystis pacifica SIR-1]
MAVEIKTPAEIEKMRVTCRFAASVLDFIAPHVVPGVTTAELDRLCHEFIVDHGAYPAPLHYRGFPGSVCTSVNEVSCHGVPGKRALEDGDIINIDVTTIVDGWFGDTSEMFGVGELSAESATLVDVTRQSMWLGIREVAPGKTIGDIGAVIHEFANGLHGYGVGEAYCGHGIGREMHMPPQVPHVGKRNTGVRLRPGMTFTIEPMINAGSPDCDLLSDRWTVVTRDRKRSAQTEHTVLVTESGYEVLTLRPGCWLPDDEPRRPVGEHGLRRRTAPAVAAGGGARR